jgi:Rieske Fe-S protein
MNSKHLPGDTNYNNIVIATGDSGNGMTHGTIAGILLTDLILGKNKKWSTLYEPSREVKEEITKGSSSGEDDDNDSKDSSSNKKINNNWEDKNSLSIESLGLEQATIIIERRKQGENENKKSTYPIAVYKDGNGAIHAFSAICTHLGCTVTWNSLEKSFDCPCHGSRFSNRGKVINGSANNNLEQKDHYSVG